MKPDINPNKVVVFTGAGVSAESGIETFRGSNGLWRNHRPSELASPEGWEANPKLVLEFYNERREKAYAAQPNAAHLAIADLQSKFEVVVITQNVDDLHERAGSKKVIHLHGMLKQACSSSNKNLVYDIGAQPIKLGDCCENGSQLRPNVVWFGEAIENYEISKSHIKEAGKFLVIGSSLSVFPAANLLKVARYHAKKIYVSPELDKTPHGFRWLLGNAATVVPCLAQEWKYIGSAI